MIKDFQEMLYGEDDGAGDDDGLAKEIEVIERERVRIAQDLLEVTDGILNDSSANSRELLVRRNRLESALFDINERVETLFEGVEENYCGIDKELEPAL